MKLLLQSLGAVALVLLIFLLGMASYGVIRYGPQVESFLKDGKDTLANVKAMTLDAKEAIGKINDRMDAETDRVAAITEETRKTARSTRAAVAVVRQIANDFRLQTLPAINQSITAQNEALLKTQDRLQENLDASQKVLVHADEQISNPAIGKAIDNLATASQNASEATAHLSNITASGERTAAYYEKRLTTPQSFVKTLVQAILQLGSQARILLAK